MVPALLTMVAERVRALSTPSPLTLLQALLQLWPAVRLAVCRIAADLTTVRAVEFGRGVRHAGVGRQERGIRIEATGGRDRTGGARSAVRGSGVGRDARAAIEGGGPAVARPRRARRGRSSSMPRIAPSRRCPTRSPRRPPLSFEKARQPATSAALSNVPRSSPVAIAMTV